MKNLFNSMVLASTLFSFSLQAWTHSSSGYWAEIHPPRPDKSRPVHGVELIKEGTKLYLKVDSQYITSPNKKLLAIATYGRRVIDGETQVYAVSSTQSAKLVEEDFGSYIYDLTPLEISVKEGREGLGCFRSPHNANYTKDTIIWFDVADL